MPTLTQHQDRYDAAERRFLEREFKIILNRISEEHSFLSDPFKAGGLEIFIEHATKCNHLLGQRVDLAAIDWGSTSANGLELKQIQFRTLPLKYRIKGTRKWRTEEHRDGIPGFGVALNLLGWTWFFNKRIGTTELLQRLDNGETIEQIFNEKPRAVGKGTTKFLMLDGEKLTTSEALRRALVSPQAYYSALKSMCIELKCNELPDDVRQAVFDDMRKAVKKRDGRVGFHYLGKKWWICLSDEDKATLETFLQRKRISAQEWLHGIVEYL